jgi:hypothetical protein
LLTRRQFIKVGLGGALLLGAVRRLGRPLAAPAPAHRFLDEPSARIVAALVPIVLAGSLPGDDDAQASAVREVVDSFDRAVSVMARSIQGEVRELFGFLVFAPSRLAFTGLWAPIDESKPEELRAFLDRWRRSRFELQRVSYQALTQLIQASWYDNAKSWGALGYAGPPALGP